MGIYIERKKKNEEIVQVIPREAVVMLELTGTQLTVQTKTSVVEVRLRPDQVNGVKALLHVFATGNPIRLKEEWDGERAS